MVVQQTYDRPKALGVSENAKASRWCIGSQLAADQNLCRANHGSWPLRAKGVAIKPEPEQSAQPLIRNRRVAVMSAPFAPPVQNPESGRVSRTQHWDAVPGKGLAKISCRQLLSAMSAVHRRFRLCLRPKPRFSQSQADRHQQAGLSWQSSRSPGPQGSRRRG